MLKSNFEIEVKRPEFPEREFDLKEFGGVADGEFDNTEVFAEAISSCHQAGGGTIVVPAGEWFTGPIHFKSNVHLKLEKGAVISFSDDFEDYLPVVFTRWEGNECYNYSPLIYAQDCENIAITGKGKLVGNGAKWWPWKQTQHAAAKELYDAEYNGIAVKDRIFGREEGLRPQFIQPINSKNILIEGITIVDGPMWTIHPVYCENTIIRDLKIITDGPNTDGINPDSCKNMLIEDCDFETGDDCIAIKSGINEDGRRVNKPTENLLIRNCKAKEGHGGVVIGSEMSGGVKNVHVYDCVFNGGERGVRLKSMRGRGGCVENLLFEDIEINNLRDQGIILNMYYDATTVEPRSEMPPLFRNITVRNIKGENIAQPVVLRGLPEKKMKDITLENINLSGKEGLKASNLDGLYLKNINLRVEIEDQFKFKNVANLNVEESSCQDKD